MFAQQDLDAVLYGYVRSACDSTGGSSSGHALSGLRVEQLSYGQYNKTPTLIVMIDFNHSKPSDVKWLQFKVFMAILV